MADDGELDFGDISEEAWRQQAEDDELLMAQAINSANPQDANVLDDFMKDGKIDQRGKADDAIDFEDMDLSDDELPDEEPNSGGAHGDVPGLTDDGGTSNDTDDLFGDPHDLSPMEALHPGIPSSPNHVEFDADENIHLSAPVLETLDDLRQLNFDHDPYEGTNQDPNIPPPAENSLEVVKQLWPGFEENTIIPWNDLFRQKSAGWMPKQPLKQPKPLMPSKLSLELDVDQEKLFRISGPAQSTVWQKIKDSESRGLVCLEEPEPLEQADLEIFNLEDDDESEIIGGFTLRDVATVCEDWDFEIQLEDARDSKSTDVPVNDEDEEWNRRYAPKRKSEIPRGLPETTRFSAPNFDGFEEATSKLGKRVILDMNDPYLLLDDADSSERANKRRKIQYKTVRMTNGKMGRDLSQRFNYSNDVAYDTLRENHAKRIRATLMSIPIEHSLPAQRLAWPYYKVKLSASDPHSFHRPQLHVGKDVIKFAKPTVVKRKSLKGKKKFTEIFEKTKDMSMNDNSTVVLAEYCEEIPVVLSNFGMGQRFVNYTRRNKASEARAEKHEIGETMLLLPEDRSPFAIFGKVESGETVPTLHNCMFRAPVFKHKPRSSDFLVGRSHTGLGGDTWYMRNIDHLYVVGQTLPQVEVPGPHSRKVTNIAKNRLKMVSYRLLRKSDHVTLHDITRHVAESNESQNRQKLKEFLRFRKDTKDWTLPDGEEMMEEEGIRALVKPEEVCLLDAMQIGAHELENGGYEIPDKDDDKDVDAMEDCSLASKMVPWKTTKNFLDASHSKAMLAVHGPGDPTGRGLGISFLKTSMKGGFVEQLQGPMATSADAIERQRKANGGHMYNVKNQDSLYQKSLDEIWIRQRESLQDAQEHDDEDVLTQEDEDERFNMQGQVAATPALEGMSQVSRSAASGLNRRKLKVMRKVQGEDGRVQTITEIVHDPVVIHQYTRRRRQREMDDIDLYNTDLTGDPERSRLFMQVSARELERLSKNIERRQKREKQKKLLQKSKGGGGGGGGGGDEGSPEPTNEKVGTTRKCANCGQVGHIKTNKKLCPILNGTWTESEQEESAGLGSMNAAPMAPSFLASS